MTETGSRSLQELEQAMVDAHAAYQQILEAEKAEKSVLQAKYETSNSATTTAFWRSVGATSRLDDLESEFEIAKNAAERTQPPSDADIKRAQAVLSAVEHLNGVDGSDTLEIASALAQADEQLNQAKETFKRETEHYRKLQRARLDAELALLDAQRNVVLAKIAFDEAELQRIAATKALENAPLKGTAAAARQALIEATRAYNSQTTKIGQTE